MPMLSFTVRDLSLGGCSALTDIPLSAGERLTVSIPIHPRFPGALSLANVNANARDAPESGPGGCIDRHRPRGS